MASQTKSSTPSSKASPKKGDADEISTANAIFAEGLSDMAASSAVGLNSAVDVAVAGLCQSYTHALSMAFHNAVADQQRRNILGQAATKKAVDEILKTEPKDFEERLTQLKKGLDVLGVSDTASMNAYKELSDGFNESMKAFSALRDKLEDKKQPLKKAS
ncbi:MAG: RebB family R body protein [Kordiimonas sp.]